MRVVFMGTGEIALPAFEALVGSDHHVVALVTQPDRPVGRRQELRAPRIKELARSHGIEVLQPESLRRGEGLEELKALAPELVVVMAYGQILPPPVLELPPVACINVHASLLPRHRGASCLQAAVDAGDPESGVTIMHMVEALDAGDIILQEAVQLREGESGGSLHDRIAELAPRTLLAALARLGEGQAAREVQAEPLVTYAPKLGREDGELDWSWPATRLERRIRAYDPWPGCFTWIEAGRKGPKRLKVFPGGTVEPAAGSPGSILEAGPQGILVACGKGALRLGDLQLDGSRRLGAAQFASGHRLAAGARFFSLAEESR